MKTSEPELKQVLVALTLDDNQAALKLLDEVIENKQNANN